MTYSEKLKSPKWQQRRLEIFSRDNWRCTSCLSKDSTLHVHHRSYLANKEPWEHPDELLTTLCEECHKKTHFVHPVARPPGKPFSVRNYSKDQLRRFVEGMIWINKHMLSQSGSIRRTIGIYGTDDPRRTVEEIEAFIRTNRG